MINLKMSPDISVSPTVTGRSEGQSGAVSLDLELLKPLRVAAVASERIERLGATDTMTV